MNQIDPDVNNSSEQPKVIVIDEFASIEKSLKGHPQSQEILEKILEYQSQVLRVARSKNNR